MDSFQTQSYSATGDYTGSTYAGRRMAASTIRQFRQRFHPYVSSQNVAGQKSGITGNDAENSINGYFTKDTYGFENQEHSNFGKSHGQTAGYIMPDVAAGSFLPQAHAYQDFLKMFGYTDHYQQLYALNCLKDISETGTGSHHSRGLYPPSAVNYGSAAPDVTASTCASLSPELDHPFYWRRRMAPAEGMTRTRDKYRVVYTEKQRIGLEKEYDENKFITAQRKTELSKELDLSERQIKIWFQNRRAKERRDMNKKDTSGKSESSNSSPNHSSSDDSVTSATSPTHQELSGNNGQAKMASCRFAKADMVTSPETYNTGQCLFQKTSPINYAGYDNQIVTEGHYGHQNPNSRYTITDTQTTTSEIPSSLFGRNGSPTFGNQRISPNNYAKQNLESIFSTQDTQMATSGHAFSPSVWNTLPSNSLVPDLNVSPITVNQDFGFAPRL